MHVRYNHQGAKLTETHRAQAPAIVQVKANKTIGSFKVPMGGALNPKKRK
jgi:hypothetical protein